MMISFLVVTLWWASGTAPMVYFSWEGRDAFTWGMLAACLGVGVAGPLIWVAIGYVALAQSGFWSKPVFGRSKKSGV